jgi:hypothetical protein
VPFESLRVEKEPRYKLKEPSALREPQGGKRAKIKEPSALREPQGGKRAKIKEPSIKYKV